MRRAAYCAAIWAPMINVKSVQNGAPLVSDSFLVNSSYLCCRTRLPSLFLELLTCLSAIPPSWSRLRSFNVVYPRVQVSASGSAPGVCYKGSFVLFMIICQPLPILCVCPFLSPSRFRLCGWPGRRILSVPDYTISNYYITSCEPWRATRRGYIYTVCIWILTNQMPVVLH